MKYWDRLWVINEIDENEVSELSSNLGISKLLAKIFLGRGIKDKNYIRTFLEPSLSDIHDPFLLKDMDKAADRIIRAVRAGEKILIYGDYDVDGITCTSVLYDFLLRLNADVIYFIPDRLEEGYGLSPGAIEKIARLKASLLITVDCGITAVEEIDIINKTNMDVIVTDHHACKDIIPSAIAVIDPWRPDCIYPFKQLAGVGVVYKLVCALCIRLGLGDLHLEYLDLAALGTVADVADLVGENRIIVKYGLEMLQSCRRPGLRALIEVAGLADKPVTSWSISFGLAPRINAAGRMGDAGRGVRLLTSAQPAESFELASALNEENKNRQEIETGIFNQAVSIIDADASFLKQKVLVIAGEGWHHGIIGIVASKISERYYKPTILISVENNLGKGSGRSLAGFNLFKALCETGMLLEKYGGHELAAGLTIQAKKIQSFRQAINAFADLIIDVSELIPKVRIDAILEKDDIILENIRALEQLAPFGEGNPGPVFGYTGIRVVDIKTVGGGDKHLKMKLQDESLYIDAIGFNMGDLSEYFNESDLVDVACSLEINSWNFSEKAQFNLKCVRLNEKVKARNSYYYTMDKCIVFGEANDYNKIIGLGKADISEIDELIPERRDLVAVYQYIKAAGLTRLQIDDLFCFSGRISKSYKLSMNYFKLKKCLDIFRELGLLEYEPLGEYGVVVEFKHDTARKTSLENSLLYRKLQNFKTQYKEAK